METWTKDNLPENHTLVENIAFVAITESTWNRKKNDGTNEVAPKWDFITEGSEENPSFAVQVYSATDKEQLVTGKKYDLIIKKNVGKDGTVYGFGLKGFAEHGQPIPKKEPRSRFEKTNKLNTKAEAIKAAVCLFKPSDKPDPDAVIEVAVILESWISGEYDQIKKDAAEAFKK